MGFIIPDKTTPMKSKPKAKEAVSSRGPLQGPQIGVRPLGPWAWKVRG